MSAPAMQEIGLDPGALRYWPDAFRNDAAALREALRAEVRWQRHRVKLFGREHLAPRLSAWHGEPGCAYRYSGVRYDPEPLGPVLSALRSRVEAITGLRFDCVLLNLYRDGSDAMGWHSDDEPELGRAPAIASLSLGSPRRFALRTRALPRRRRDLVLEDGSLLLMLPPVQAHWQHALPRTRRPCSERLNLTWRLIGPA